MMKLGITNLLLIILHSSVVYGQTLGEELECRGGAPTSNQDYILKKSKEIVDTHEKLIRYIKYQKSMDIKREESMDLLNELVGKVLSFCPVYSISGLRYVGNVDDERDGKLVKQIQFIDEGFCKITFGNFVTDQLETEMYTYDLSNKEGKTTISAVKRGGGTARKYDFQVSSSGELIGTDGGEGRAWRVKCSYYVY